MIGCNSRGSHCCTEIVSEVGGHFRSVAVAARAVTDGIKKLTSLIDSSSKSSFLGITYALEFVITIKRVCKKGNSHGPSG
jgi:hypothetical protein